jgi:hypothetical protein
MAKVIDLGYRARKQFVPYHMRKERWACLVAHRRAGKTVACVADVLDAALRCTKKDGRFAYVAPQFNQVKDIAWNYLKRFVAPIPNASINESELRVDLPNGARVRLYGADNPDRLRGLYLDGIVLDEYADMHPSVWGEVIRPLLADRQGWATFIGTPKGKNAFYEIFERAQNSNDWFSDILRASTTGLLLENELQSAAQDMTPEQYAQEFECSFEAAIVGAYYGSQIAEVERAGRICEVKYDASVPLYTAWDLGIADSTAIWVFQIIANEIHVIDTIENHGQPLSWYVGELNARGYNNSIDYLPHDARARELGSGRTRVETLQSLGRKSIRIVEHHKLADGINAARLTFAHCWFDEHKTKQAIEALRQYRREYDEKARAFRDVPKHNWTSHYSDAFRYLAMAWREIKPQPKSKDVIKELTKPRTFDDIVKMYEYERELDD